MTPVTTTLFGGLEQVFLPVFLIVLLVGFVGGNPMLAVKLLLDLFGVVLGAVIGLLCTFLPILLRLTGSLIVMGGQLMSTTISTSMSTRKNK
jgi:hypothetical protein